MVYVDATVGCVLWAVGCGWLWQWPSLRLWALWSMGGLWAMGYGESSRRVQASLPGESRRVFQASLPGMMHDRRVFQASPGMPGLAVRLQYRRHMSKVIGGFVVPVRLDCSVSSKR